MTSYVFSVSNQPSPVTGGGTLTAQTYALTPGLFEVRIAQVYYSAVSVAVSGGGSGDNAASAEGARVGFAPTMYRNSGGSASGGSAVSPIAFRQGAASPSATARWGTSLSISGTQTALYPPVPITATSSSNSIVTYTFPADLVVSPGEVLSFSTGGMGTGYDSGFNNPAVTATIQLMIYFEELRLGWHY